MKICKEDIIASLIVFIVALPLSLGVALASGASLEAGLITAVIGGVLCGLLSGAPLVVAGPAAGLTALIYQLVQQYGIAGLAIITVIAGIIQFGMGLLKLGRFFTFVPKAILEGMLSVIGFIIAFYQIHVLLGQSVPTSMFKAFSSLPEAMGSVYWPILLCGGLAIFIQLYWSKMPKSLSWIPGALPAVLIATLVSLFWEMPRVQIADFVSHISSAFSVLSIGSVTSISSKMLLSAMGLALVASAETLLTAIALEGNIAKRGHKEHKTANLDHELLAHGFSNTVSGFFGGLPMTGVIVRSAVNVSSGAKTRMSTMLHGVWIALFVIFAPDMLQKIPLTALAAVLIVTGFKLLNANEFIKVITNSRWQGLLWVVTFLAILKTDLLTGLSIGIGVYLVGSLITRTGDIQNWIIQKRLKEKFLVQMSGWNRGLDRKKDTYRKTF